MDRRERKSFVGTGWETQIAKLVRSIRGVNDPDREIRESLLYKIETDPDSDVVQSLIQNPEGLNTLLTKPRFWGKDRNEALTTALKSTKVNPEYAAKRAASANKLGALGGTVVT